MTIEEKWDKIDENFEYIHRNLDICCQDMCEGQWSKLKLEETEIFLKNKLSELQKQEIALAKSLSDKYGEGSLDIETETFTPTK